MKLIVIDERAIDRSMADPSPWSKKNPAPRHIAHIETIALVLADSLRPVRWLATRWGYSTATAHRVIAEAREMQEALL